MSDMTIGSINFGQLAESNWHKAEAQRLDAENISLIRRLNEAKRLLEQCFSSDHKIDSKRVLFLQQEDDRL